MSGILGLAHLEAVVSDIRALAYRVTRLERNRASVLYGEGSPASVVSAPVGTLYVRTDGGTSTTLYVKESGTGSSGWVAK